MLTVACIKWGTKYPAEYVNKLQRAVSRHLSIPHRFVCYTDCPEGLACDAVFLPKGHVGWWNKLYLFSLNEHVLLLDLDMVVVGNLDGFVDYRFMALQDPWQKGYNSSIVNIPPGMAEVWSRYLEERPQYRLHGDQDWLNIVPGYHPDNCYPHGMAKSYKAEVKREGVGAASVVYFHGNPKPHEVKDAFVLENWK